jgi:hypothetical protein
MKFDISDNSVKNGFCFFEQQGLWEKEKEKEKRGGKA